MASGNRIDITIAADACIFWALALLILPLRWILGALAAAVIHECCHYLALHAYGIPVWALRISACGAEMETGPMEKYQELFCAMAGPVGSFMLIPMVRWFPELAVCAGIQGMYNLLPVLPLDGGRVVGCILGILLPDRQEKLMGWIQKGMIALIILAGIWGYFRLKLGVSVLFVVLLLVRKGLPRKIPCKEGRKRVQ